MKITLSFALLASLVAVGSASSVADILANINDIIGQVTTLRDTVAALPDKGGSLLRALPLHSGASSVVAAMTKGITDFNGLPGPLSMADGTKILNALQGVEPIIDEASKAIAAKQNTFREVPLVGNLVNPVAQYHLMSVKATGAKLTDAFLSVAPESQKDRAKALKTLSDAAIDHAIAAFT
ncbi:hydrophobic surface binding protein A-domain-containing protein [Lyophyllum atratum]|nr:hydrophobic surface binding protein A-domain-containing protein [Lyophyllum atratum]